MGTPRHAKVLSQGVAVWNDWRRDNPGTRPDLRREDLRDIDLSEADLHCADIRFAFLTGAKLRRADLREADLAEANLRCADLWEADLRKTTLHKTDLSQASLIGAHLEDAHFEWTTVGAVDLADAVVGLSTTFSGVDLSEVKGLDRVCFRRYPASEPWEDFSVVSSGHGRAKRLD